MTLTLAPPRTPARIVCMRTSGSAVLLTIVDDNKVLRFLRFAHADDARLNLLTDLDRGRVAGALLHMAHGVSDEG